MFQFHPCPIRPPAPPLNLTRALPILLPPHTTILLTYKFSVPRPCVPVLTNMVPIRRRAVTVSSVSFTGRPQLFIQYAMYEGKSLNNRNFILKCLEKYAQWKILFRDTKWLLSNMSYRSNETPTWCNTVQVYISAESLYMFRAQAPIIRSI